MASEGKYARGEAGPALRVVLRSVFAKPEFNPGQREAIERILSGGDCVVLLPTGAGKSLIYQLVGLLLGGTTLIVDPLIALIEDQRRSLGRAGIDRVGSLSSDMRVAERATNEVAIASGACLYVLVSPERLQTESFREQLREMLASAHVRMAVADEAHCVSEWGHSFRPAYLRLGETLRRVCRSEGGKEPVIVGLTGTASRQVLTDVLSELGIDGSDQAAQIVPRSFDRPELKYEVIRTTPNDALPTVVRTLRQMPAAFGGPASGAVKPEDYSELPGIVFCTTIGGSKGSGVTAVQETVARTLDLELVTYHGRSPKGLKRGEWAEAKRRNAEAFISDDVPLMVATKAFGMGIDKPNIRYVIHVGIPSSIEAYYQEAGRAARDQGVSRCVLITYTPDAQMPSAGVTLQEIKKGAAQRTGTDVSTQQYFHANTFSGQEVEMKTLDSVLDELGPLGEDRRVAVPKVPPGVDRKEAEAVADARERALYRLVLLGASHEYFVTAQSFEVVLRETSSAEIVDASVDYVRHSQPLMTKPHEERVSAYRTAPLNSAVRGVGEAVIAFVYLTIERTRARALQEMAQAAAAALEDGEVLRERILSYLSTGPAADVMEPLVHDESFEADVWTAALDEIISSSVDPRDLRGDAARLLEDSPSNPGLLLARGLSEVLDPNGNLEVFEEHMELVVETDGVLQVQSGPEDVERYVRWIADHTREARDGAHAIVANVLRYAGLTARIRREIEDELLMDPKDKPLNAAVGLAAHLKRARSSVDRAITQLAA